MPLLKIVDILPHYLSNLHFSKLRRHTLAFFQQGSSSALFVVIIAALAVVKGHGQEVSCALQILYRGHLVASRTKGSERRHCFDVDFHVVLIRVSPKIHGEILRVISSHCVGWRGKWYGEVFVQVEDENEPLPVLG